MMVKDAVRILSSYDNQDQEIFIEWWDKETVEANAERSLTDEQWEEIVLFEEDFEQPHGTSALLCEKAWEITEEAA